MGSSAVLHSCHSRTDTEISIICGAFSGATRIYLPEQWDACKSCRHHHLGPLGIAITALVQEQSFSKFWFNLCVKLLLSDLQQTFVHLSQPLSQFRLTQNTVTSTSNLPQRFFFHHQGKDSGSHSHPGFADSADAFGQKVSASRLPILLTFHSFHKWISAPVKVLPGFQRS